MEATRWWEDLGGPRRTGGRREVIGGVGGGVGSMGVRARLRGNSRHRQVAASCGWAGQQRCCALGRLRAACLPAAAACCLVWAAAAPCGCRQASWVGGVLYCQLHAPQRGGGMAPLWRCSSDPGLLGPFLEAAGPSAGRVSLQLAPCSKQQPSSACRLCMLCCWRPGRRASGRRPLERAAVGCSHQAAGPGFRF